MFTRRNSCDFGERLDQDIKSHVGGSNRDASTFVIGEREMNS